MKIPKIILASLKLKILSNYEVEYHEIANIQPFLIYENSNVIWFSLISNTSLGKILQAHYSLIMYDRRNRILILCRELFIVVGSFKNVISIKFFMTPLPYYNFSILIKQLTRLIVNCLKHSSFQKGYVHAICSKLPSI